MNHHELKKFGLKVTSPRLRIIELLEGDTRRHLTAEEIYQSLLALGEDIGLATVYRVLTQFETVGLVIRHHFEGGLSVFELNDGDHHDHLLCVKCGRIEEFCDEAIETRQSEVAEKRGFTVADHCLYIYVTCQNFEKCPYYQRYKNNKR